MKKRNWEGEFKTEKELMWSIKEKGETFNLPIDLEHLKKLNIAKWKENLIKKQLPSDNVTYSIIDNMVFVHESNDKYDWKQNAMAFTIKLFLLGEYHRFHAGFCLTAFTVFDHMKDNGFLNDDLRFDAYSHGAGATPQLCIMICDAGHKMPRLEGNMESPNYILRPSKKIKELCSHFINYKQGNDIVTGVPWWHTKLGQIRKVKGLKLPWYKRPFKMLFNHDVRPKKKLRSKQWRKN